MTARPLSRFTPFDCCPPPPAHELTGGGFHGWWLNSTNPFSNCAAGSDSNSAITQASLCHTYGMFIALALPDN